MATPPRNLITADIAATLATITVANGYKTTVQTVDRVIKNWSEIGTEEFPWVGFCFPREQLTERVFGMVDVRMQGVIVGHINTGTDLTRSNLLGNLQDDLIAALHVDCTRGGNAITTLLKGDSENDEGDSATMDHRGGTGSLVLRFEVFYERTVQKS